MGVRDPVQRTFPVHQQFVRRHGCAVPGCLARQVDFAHVKTRGAGADDSSGVPLCRVHHAEEHTIGINTFQAKYKIDLHALAAEFVRRTPDKALREMLRDV